MEEILLYPLLYGPEFGALIFVAYLFRASLATILLQAVAFVRLRFHVNSATVARRQKAPVHSAEKIIPRSPSSGAIRIFKSVFPVLLLSWLVGNASGQAHVTTEPVAKDGTAVQIHLPRALHLKNTGGSDGPRGPGSGSGLCVFTSLNHAAYWNRLPVLYDFQSWMTHYPGGGYPSKVDAMIQKKAQAAGQDKPEYLQFEANNLDLLALACKTGRMPSVTYSFSPTKRYGGARIAHMVSLVSARSGKGPDGKGWWCVLDNNFPGTYEWMPEADFLRTYSGGRLGWSVVFLNPAPPPVPLN